MEGDHLHFTLEIAGQTLTCRIVPMGEDVSICLFGGQRPHIGCTVLAIPRPSLTGSGCSATVSMLNRTGHKDDIVAAHVAKAVASRRNCAVSCSCGIHIDNASPRLLKAIAAAPDAIAQRICVLLDSQNANAPHAEAKSALRQEPSH